jgi:hypothetical protein
LLRTSTLGFPHATGLGGILLCLVAAPAGAAVSTGTDEEAQLPYWEIAERGVSIRLVQRLPDQTRGFFQARGFSEADAERIAQSCVFQTIFKNVSPASDPSVVEYNLRDWTVHAAGTRRGMKTREDWQKDWSERQAPLAAQIAFEWALLPTRQTYQPGDYNWGMTVFNLKPDSEFDLDVVWRERGNNHAVRVKGVRCAPDIQLPPAAP